jgi:hypothetical protein
MESLLKFAPLLNTLIIVGVALITILRVRDIMIRVEMIVEKQGEALTRMDKRLTIVETVCRINHPLHGQIQMDSEQGD